MLSYSLSSPFSQTHLHSKLTVAHNSKSEFQKKMFEAFQSKQKLSETKLKNHRQDTNQCQRELQRDRQELDRYEQKLMVQIKLHADKGNMNKAKILAHQVSKYRELSDRNFQTATTIQSQAQVIGIYFLVEFISFS